MKFEAKSILKSDYLFGCKTSHYNLMLIVWDGRLVEAVGVTRSFTEKAVIELANKLQQETGETIEFNAAELVKAAKEHRARELEDYN